MPGELVPADNGEIAHHCHSVTDYPYCRSFLASQADRQSLNVVVSLQGNIKKLHVKRESANASHAEKVLGYFRTEALHAALCVEPAARDEATYDERVNVTAEAADKR